MFQLFDLIMTSAIGVFLLSTIQNLFYGALLAGECDECGFNDLGKLLFGGLILAVLVGIFVSLLYRRSRDRNAADSEFVSMRLTNEKR